MGGRNSSEWGGVRGTEGSLPSIFNNLIGKNFRGKKDREYIKFIAMEELGFEKAEIKLYQQGKYIQSGIIK